jgi:large subunit ribosomal protein L22
MLRLVPRRSARLLAKTLKSALANAENNRNLSADRLVLSQAIVNEGPRLKRFVPAARGSAHPIRKRTSHIKMVLT